MRVIKVNGNPEVAFSLNRVRPPYPSSDNDAQLNIYRVVFQDWVFEFQCVINPRTMGGVLDLRNVAETLFHEGQGDEPGKREASILLEWSESGLRMPTSPLDFRRDTLTDAERLTVRLDLDHERQKPEKATRKPRQPAAKTETELDRTSEYPRSIGRLTILDKSWTRYVFETRTGDSMAFSTPARSITRPLCVAIISAMANMNATARGTAKLESEIMRKAGHPKSRIAGAFGAREGEADHYHDFRRNVIKNAERKGRYYLDVA